MSTMFYAAPYFSDSPGYGKAMTRDLTKTIPGLSVSDESELLDDHYSVWLSEEDDDVEHSIHMAPTYTWIAKYCGYDAKHDAILKKLSKFYGVVWIDEYTHDDLIRADFNYCQGDEEAGLEEQQEQLKVAPVQIVAGMDQKPNIDQLRTKLKNTGNLLGIDVTLLTAEDNNATTNNQESEVTQ